MAIPSKFTQSMFITMMFISSLCQARNLIENQTMPIEQRYRRWLLEQGRNSFNGAGEDEHFEIFKKNAEYVDKINSEDRPFKLALNKWADITNEDFKARLGYKRPHNVSESSSPSPPFKTIQYEEAKELPPYVDWRERGAVTPIKQQGDCGSCWAFSAVAALEGMTKVVQGLLLELSVQQVVDCDPHSHGCHGGWVTQAYDFFIKNNGITTESEYPYVGINKGSVCRKNDEFLALATIYGYVNVPNDENELLKAVAQQPVSIGVNANCDAFRLYESGILTENCGNQNDHFITLVGYGEENGNKYWLAKNSWGTDWGEKGYIRMCRNCGIDGGLCGLQLQASYPTF